MQATSLQLPGGSIDLTKRRKEMSLFEQLGPLSRAVIADSPIDIDLDRMLTAFRQHNANARSRLLMGGQDAEAFNASLDQPMAKYLTDAITAKVPGYKPITIQRRARHHG